MSYITSTPLTVKQLSRGIVPHTVHICQYCHLYGTFTTCVVGMCGEYGWQRSNDQRGKKIQYQVVHRNVYFEIHCIILFKGQKEFNPIQFIAAFSI